MSKKQREIHDKHRKELEDTLNETIEETIRQAAVPPAPDAGVAEELADGLDIGVVLGSFVINLLLLMAVTGG